MLSDLALIRSFILLECRVLERPGIRAPGAESEPDSSLDCRTRRAALHLRDRRCLGHGPRDQGGVLAGSSARKGQSSTFPAGCLALRDALLADGRLAEDPQSGLYRFATDVLFSSPSAAASIVAARSASGPLEWKVAGTGQSYKDWRAARLQHEV